MADGPNLAPGRCVVPPSNGAPTMTTSAPAYDSTSDRSHGGTPRKVRSGPYIAPYRVISFLKPTVIRIGSAYPEWPQARHIEQFSLQAGSRPALLESYRYRSRLNRNPTFCRLQLRKS